MRRRSRWAVVLGGVAVLVSMPAAIASLPVDDPDVSTAALLERIATSADQQYRGLFESRGGLGFPDLGRYEDLVAPFAETTRVRVWYMDSENWRADTQSIGGEVNWYREPDGLWRWNSESRRVTHSSRSGPEPLRFPRVMDLSPAELGRRVLHEAVPEEVTRIGPRRVAGRVTAGLRITPRSTTTTITGIDLWVEPTTGLVLRAEIETGGTNPIVETQFLDFSAAGTSTDILRFDAEESEERVRETSSFDVVEQISRSAALIAPATAAVDLPRRGSETSVTFGSDFGIVVVGLAPERGLGRALNALPPEMRPWGGEASLVETPLVNVEIATINGLNYVLGGTVTIAELDRIAGLIADSAAS